MPAYILPPDALEQLTVSGPDASRLLQGQVTSDIAALQEGELQWGALCNNKGRVLSPFVALLRNERYHLIFGKGLSTIFSTHMAKYLPFYKCSITADSKLLGLVGDDVASKLEGQSLPATGQVLGSDTGWVARPAADLVLLGKDEGPVQLATDGLVRNDEEAERRWRLGLLLAGHYPFEASDSERYTPQELHYDSNGYVSFTKGCYTGQEIVARMHYRGKVKKQLYLAKLQGDSVPTPESLVFHDSQGNALGAARYVVQHDATQLLALVSLPVELAPEALPLHCEPWPVLELSPFQRAG